MNERYWKDKSLYHVIFSCKINTNKISEATFQTLQLNSQIASKWTISPPCHYDDNKWDFEGVAQNVLISGIELISFRLHNYENKYMKEVNNAS